MLMFSCYLFIHVVRKLKYEIHCNFSSSDLNYFKCMVFVQNDSLLTYDYLVMDLKICSLNVRGFGERLKRKGSILLAKSKTVFNLSAARNSLI